MGSVITLGIEQMEIDWGKNNIFTNHSNLFQKKDFKYVPYYYVKDEELIEIEKEGYSKKLSSVKKRLNLLGYDLRGIENKFNENLVYLMNLYGREYSFSFENFYSAIINIDISKINMTASSYFNEYDLGEYVKKCILEEIESIKNLKLDLDYGLDELLENLSPYIILRILAENEKNKDYSLIWRTADIIENGWAIEDDLTPNLPSEQKITIVTEGTSDRDIIKETINNLYSDISDFFEFIDMEKNYPFTGTGSLGNFIKGLSKIHIQNKVLVILDNDTAGIETLKKLEDIKRPNNLHVVTLPEYESFKKIKCLGPEGTSYGNINGRAVSIEAFLDFKSVSEEIYVRWRNYNKKTESYQGVIEPKKALIKAFHSQFSKEYDTKKLEYLIDYILESWIKK